jgi:DNA polymerase III subunit alpha
MESATTTRPFVHLHCHSHYSLLDGAASIERLITRAQELGMNALALTDHGNLHGALEFYKKSRTAGINPILGYEAYIAPGSRTVRDASTMKEASYHLTLLAQNRTGFRNLVKMASAAMLDGFYFKPRIDKELLQAHQEGIVCLSGCVSSELSRSILRHRDIDEQALHESEQIAAWFQSVFGERYFLEIMNNGAEVQRLALEGTLRVSQRMGIPLVATSDTHYVEPEDAEVQDVLLCINTGKFRTDTQRMRMDGNQYYLRAPEAMYAAFPGLEAAVERSQFIANTVDIDLQLGKRHFPTYPLPREKTAEQMLLELCLQGLKERYAGNDEMCPQGELAAHVLERLEHELSVINKLGFANYFLIVWDFVRKARDMSIPATARGSGVGALVSYALYLSHVCPIKFDLLFERFLDVNRREAPDIDIDFCKERRGEIIRYVKEKYGEDNVAQIGTFGTLAARAAIRDVGRALGLPLNRVSQIVAMVPEVLGITLSKALKQSEELKQTYEKDPEVRELLDFAQRIEGLARNVGTHAAAVVIADQPLTEYVPLGRVTGKNDVITQWSMNDVEAAGLLKMDFLGLRNLTILSKAVDLIEQTTGKRIDPHKFPLDDKKTFALLCRGETKGIFQLESGGIRDLLQKMKPDCFLDIIATNALYRPGPLEGGMVDDYVDVKHGRKEAEYKHPVLRDVLTETHGVMVYQEQVMRILNRLGGIELAAAYTCIKAISKKKEELITANYARFIAGATEGGLSRSEADDLWNLIIKFAGYGFNKSHSTAYALIAFQTAYLKAHFPVEFMAALLSGDIPGRNFKKKDSLVEHLEDCQRMKIEVMPPDVNRSDADFRVVEGKIVFGLSAIKGCGGAAAEAVASERKKNGPFRDIFDFCERVESASRSMVETLIKAGAFDSFAAGRRPLLEVVEKALQAGASAQADRRRGQKSLFGDLDDSDDSLPITLPNVPELDDRERLLMEKEVLGFYLTSHPLAEYETTLATYRSHTTGEISELRHRDEVILGGMLSAIKFSHTRSARPGQPTRFANFDLEDKDGTIRCILWPDDFEKFGPLVQADAVLVVRGAVDRSRGDEANLVVNELIPLDQLDARYTTGIRIRLDARHHDQGTLIKIREIVRGYPGTCELQMVLVLEDGSQVVLRSQRVQIDVTSELRTRLDDLLGPGNYRLMTAAPKPVRAGSREPSAAGYRRD